MQNVFSLTFGKESINILNRYTIENEIIESFTSDNPSNQAYILTGVRGSGKTVALTVIGNKLRNNKDWIVVDLSSERDMLSALCAELSGRRDLLKIFKQAKINISLMGVVGLEIGADATVTDTNVVLDRMLDKLTAEGKRILVTVDEVTSNKCVREFVSQYQIFVRKNYNIFLLMTGLYENIYELQNEKTLTFLYRAPKLEMKPLSISSMMKKYQDILGVDETEALNMAKLTKGYPYAFQLLGYLCFQSKQNYESLLFEFDDYLEQYVYDKIWSELSEMDKRVLLAMSCITSCKVEDIRKQLAMDSNLFNVYRKRLLKKGLVIASQYGYLEFSLPRFKDFVIRTTI